MWREGGGQKSSGSAGVARETEGESDGEVEHLREGSCYLSPALRLRLQQEQDVRCHTVLQFHGDALILPAGAMHQVGYSPGTFSLYLFSFFLSILPSFVPLSVSVTLLSSIVVVPLKTL